MTQVLVTIDQQIPYTIVI